MLVLNVLKLNIVNDTVLYIKSETHRANRWPSEAFGETQTSSGTILYGVFGCIGSFWNRVDSTCYDSACEV